VTGRGSFLCLTPVGRRRGRPLDWPHPVTVVHHHAPIWQGEWMTGSRALGLPSGITRNLANTTTPTTTTRTAALPHACSRDPGRTRPSNPRV